MSYEENGVKIYVSIYWTKLDIQGIIVVNAVLLLYNSDLVR